MVARTRADTGIRVYRPAGVGLLLVDSFLAIILRWLRRKPRDCWPPPGGVPGLRNAISRAVRAPHSPSLHASSVVLPVQAGRRSEEHTSELQSHHDLVCRLLLDKKTNPWADQHGVDA